MTLYLSRLLLDPRSRQVWKELAEPYEMHRTVMRAFPKATDEAKCKAREEYGVLFRVEETKNREPVTVLVQSGVAPDWSYLEGVQEYLDATVSPNPEVKTISPALKEGQRLRFRLKANPTMKRKDGGKRLGLFKEEDQLKWLDLRAWSCGFTILSSQVMPQGKGSKGTLHKDGKVHTATMLSVLFDGVIQVTDPEKFLVKALASGIGSGKGFGFGLLSVAPHRDDA